MSVYYESWPFCRREQGQKLSEKQTLREVLACVRCEVLGNDACFLTFVEMQMRSIMICDFTKCRMVVYY